MGWLGRDRAVSDASLRPRAGLDNLSIKFRETTLFERTALHEPDGWHAATATGMVAANGLPSLSVADANELAGSTSSVAGLRDELHQQAELGRARDVRLVPDFAAKGSWGMITSSWAAQFITVCERLGSQALAAPITDAFFAGDDDFGSDAAAGPSRHDARSDAPLSAPRKLLSLLPAASGKPVHELSARIHEEPAPKHRVHGEAVDESFGVAGSAGAGKRGAGSAARLVLQCLRDRLRVLAEMRDERRTHLHQQRLQLGVLRAGNQRLVERASSTCW